MAFLKVAPFIQVEKKHLRDLILKENPGGAAYDRMAFALRQLRIESLPDTTDALQATLHMTWFNYRPFSLDFGYSTVGDRSVEA